MGITPLTLGLASIRKGAEIPDHKSGEMVLVKAVYKNKNPYFTLIYPSGFKCEIKWQDGQGFPGYTDGCIPFVPGGRKGWYEQAGKKPKACSAV